MAFTTPNPEAPISDDELVQGVKDGQTWLFEIIMRRYNQRLFRVVRAIVKNESETEEIMQDAYVRAYEHLDQFMGRSKFSTWLTKIAVYESYAVIRQRKRLVGVDDFLEDVMTARDPSPEQLTFDSELRSLLEAAVDNLPGDYRAVFVMRDIEGLSTAETAECLDLTEENVKVRLHRARALLRRDLLNQVGASSVEAFQFLGARCDRIVKNVLERIRDV